MSCHYYAEPSENKIDGIAQQKQLELAVSKLTSTMLLDEVKSIQLERA